MKSNIFVLMAAISMLKTGCNGSTETNAIEVNMDSVEETYEAKSIEEAETFDPEITKDVSENLKIIKNASCRFKVADVDKATSSVKDVLRKYNGYVSEMRFQNTRYQLENRLSMRVPAKEFEAVISELSETAEYIDFKNVSTTDVSEEYIDLQTRLKTKMAVKERYDEILRSKAKTVEEVLLSEEKLRVLQEEIEAAQGRLKFLSNKVALSTIQLDLYQTVEHRDVPEEYNQSFTSKMKDSLVFGWRVVEKMFLGLLYIWPFVLFGTGLFIYLKYIRKSSK
ncbi:DUF4349 domain-containing protein [Poritiphilus flavus]|uniref:DUF4349 domain-containing protein n=1 Tax=Poritiphilus flavus TaxID=2697053 RepID=A0A6L9EHX7_9FLAO|nr:DUF4349 domain-containing protein [Poritiphilus flavus]NAS14262.1 DUF4349 domain-containing protein [Poritiphilus flavus]